MCPHCNELPALFLWPFFRGPLRPFIYLYRFFSRQNDTKRQTHKKCSLLYIYLVNDDSFWSISLVMETRTSLKKMASICFEAVVYQWRNGYPKSAKKWVEVNLNKAFLHFLPYLMIFQSFTAPSVWSILENHKIMQKNEEKACSTPFSTKLGMYPIPRFRVPVSPLSYTT